jgi:tetratricopeptide (TPR) repeat protein
MPIRPRTPSSILGPEPRQGRFILTGLLALGLVASAPGCGKDAKPEVTGEADTSAPQPAEPPLTPEQLETVYHSSKARIEATATLPEASVAEIEGDLRRVAEQAEDVHLRANASLLLGHLFEARQDQRAAISYYRQAAELIPDEVEPHIVLALALARSERWDEAIAEQYLVVEMIPDDLVGWLLLGELHVKGGKLDEATTVYGAYELRRKGLIDGLTLKQGGEYVKDEDERAACALALAPAIDNGTALALMYALDSDPSPQVRARVAQVMGEQRLSGYEKLLRDKLAGAEEQELREAIEWALAEIERDGVETAPGPVPESIAKQVEAEAEAQKAKAEAEAEAEEQGGAAGEGADPPDQGAEAKSEDAPAL